MAKLSMKGKLVASLASICTILLISCLISFMEYRRVSSYVSDLIDENIRSVNVTRALSDAANSYNVGIMSVIGDDDLKTLPDFDAVAFLAGCDSLDAAFGSERLKPLCDSVKYAFATYMLTALELPKVLQSNDFGDSRSWYFTRLRPRYLRLQEMIGRMSAVIYEDLNANSEAFDSVFYRSIMPGVVAVFAGMLLTLMLLFYLLQYYARPLEKMNRSLSLWRSLSKNYNCEFEGDDCLSSINESIRTITEENAQLRDRVAKLRGSREKDTSVR